MKNPTIKICDAKNVLKTWNISYLWAMIHNLK
jgi:hypothetical protein